MQITDFPTVIFILGFQAFAALILLSYVLIREPSTFDKPRFAVRFATFMTVFLVAEWLIYTGRVPMSKLALAISSGLLLMIIAAISIYRIARNTQMSPTLRKFDTLTWIGYTFAGLLAFPVPILLEEARWIPEGAFIWVCMVYTILMYPVGLWTNKQRKRLASAGPEV